MADIAIYLGIAGFIGMGVLSYYFIRNLKRKNIAAVKTLRSTGGVDSENAYSTIATTEQIASYVRSRGADVSGAEEYIRLAREAYGQASYKLSVDYCDRAKRMLEDSKNKMSGEQLQPSEEAETSTYDVEGISSRLVEITETKGEDHKMVRLSREYKEAEIENLNQLNGMADEAIGKKDNKLPAKFMLQRARESIANAKKAGRPVEEALDELDLADEAFENSDFDQALTRANRSRKMADGEEILPPVEESPIGEEEIAANEVGEERYYCPECEGEVSEDAKFCRHCGTKLLEEMLVCPSCDATLPADSAFCSKCGQKM